MDQQTCVCGKVIEGVNQAHIKKLLQQHRLGKQHKKNIKDKVMGHRKNT